MIISFLLSLFVYGMHDNIWYWKNNQHWESNIILAIKMVYSKKHTGLTSQRLMILCIIDFSILLFDFGVCVWVLFYYIHTLQDIFLTDNVPFLTLFVTLCEWTSIGAFNKKIILDENSKWKKGYFFFSAIVNCAFYQNSSERGEMKKFIKVNFNSSK